MEYRTQFYEPYQPNLTQRGTRRIDLGPIAALNAAAQQAIENFMAQHGGRLEDYFYRPLRGRNKDIVKVLSRKDGKPVGWIAMSPWLSDYQGMDGN